MDVSNPEFSLKKSFGMDYHFRVTLFKVIKENKVEMIRLSNLCNQFLQRRLLINRICFMVFWL